LNYLVLDSYTYKIISSLVVVNKILITVRNQGSEWVEWRWSCATDVRCAAPRKKRSYWWTNEWVAAGMG